MRHDWVKKEVDLAGLGGWLMDGAKVFMWHCARCGTRFEAEPNEPTEVFRLGTDCDEELVRNVMEC